MATADADDESPFVKTTRPPRFRPAMARRGRMQTVQPWQLEGIACSAFSLVSSPVLQIGIEQ